MSFTPFGRWPSPISPRSLAFQNRAVGQVHLDPAGAYWIERRPQEQGRNALYYFDFTRQKILEVSPSSLNIRTRVYEYGGRGYIPTPYGVLGIHAGDQRPYLFQGGKIRRQLQISEKLRLANFAVDPVRDTRLVAICEDHNGSGEPNHSIISLDLEQERLNTLVSGADFYAHPRISPDGRYMAWICWNHPAMPWEETELWSAELNDQGFPLNPFPIASGKKQSRLQPEWSADNTLYFLDDSSSWWNIHRSFPELPHAAPECICPRAADFAHPPWIFGLESYGVAKENKLVCSYTKEGRWYLAILTPGGGSLENIELPYTEIWSLCASQSSAVFCAGGPQNPGEVVHLDLESGKTTLLSEPGETGLDPSFISIPQSGSCPTTRGGKTYFHYYPPCNPQVTAPENSPPLLINIHGGPTMAASTVFNRHHQFWTSRGVAVADVNYRGSTGFGRQYRDALQGAWGEVDVEDCLAVAEYLADMGKVDPERIAVTGGSAGALTALLVQMRALRVQVASLFSGVYDLQDFSSKTHKFESHYLDWLLGTEKEMSFQNLSPLELIDQIQRPVVLFHGEQDPVAPPEHARAFFNALQAKGVKIEVLFFPEEEHGLRLPDNVERAIEKELDFFSRVLGFTAVSAKDQAKG